MPDEAWQSDPWPHIDKEYSKIVVSPRMKLINFNGTNLTFINYFSTAILYAVKEDNGDLPTDWNPKLPD